MDERSADLPVVKIERPVIPAAGQDPQLNVVQERAQDNVKKLRRDSSNAKR